MKPKLTPWFPGNVLPERAGFYEVKRGLHVHNIYPKQSMLRFDGKEWRHTEHSSNGSFVESYATMLTSDKWRGLVTPPENSKA